MNQKNELILGLGEGYQIVPPVTVPTGSSNILIDQEGTVQATPPGSATSRTIRSCNWLNSPVPTACGCWTETFSCQPTSPARRSLARREPTGWGLSSRGFLSAATSISSASGYDCASSTNGKTRSSKPFQSIRASRNSVER